MVIQKIYAAQLDIVEVMDETERNSGGFGHTGK
jgi:dUTP pyrophosphatase